MEFGHVYDSLEAIDFTLPPDTEFTVNTLKTKKSEGKLSVYVGASKWGEKRWKGIIYPVKLPDNELLSVYCQNFNTVEFAMTFYNIYSADELKRWTDQVKELPGFKFCPRFPQTISHIRRLINAEEPTARFYKSLSAFGENLGPLMLQLGDNFTHKSFPQLKSYLESLPRSIKASVEMRHKEWFSNADHRNKLLRLFYDLDIGFTISDTSGRRDVVHMNLTTTDAVIRFVGNNLDDTDYKRMDDWVDRLKDWSEQGLKSVWFFMHQNDERYAPEAIIYFITQLNDKLGLSLNSPTLIGK